MCVCACAVGDPPDGQPLVSLARTRSAYAGSATAPASTGTMRAACNRLQSRVQISAKSIAFFSGESLNDVSTERGREREREREGGASALFFSIP